MVDENSQSTSSQNSTEESPVDDVKKKSPFDKLKSLALPTDKKQRKKILLISGGVLIIGGLISFMVWGMAVWAIAYFMGEPSGNATLASGECYMPDENWINPSMIELPSAEMAITKLGKRDVLPDKADVEKILKDARARGVNPAVTLATWGKEQGFGKRVEAYGCPMKETGFDAQTECQINTMVNARDNKGAYSGRPDDELIQKWWIDIYTPESDRRNNATEDRKNFFHFLNLLVPDQIICSKATSGAVGVGQNNVPLFRQCDPKWGDHPYPKPEDTSKTICSSGCGSTAAAMVLKFYGKDVDPKITADFCRKNGHRVSDGTDPNCFSDLAKNYDLKIDTISGWDNARRILESGKPLIISVAGQGFTSGDGHYIVLTGVKGDIVYINDSSKKKIPSAQISRVTAAFKHGYYYIHP